MAGGEDRREVKASVYEVIELGKTLHQAGRTKEAEGIYVKILDAIPEQVEALHFLGLLRHEQERWDEAIDLIRRALDVDPSYLDARSNLGNLYRLTDDNAAAEREYRRVLEQNPKMVDTWNNLGTVLFRQGDSEGATEAYQKALELDRDHAEAWQNLGNQFRRAGKYEEAAEAYRQALALRPNRAQVYLDLGRSLYLSGQLDQAAAVYRKWLETDPENEIAEHMLAACSGDHVPGRASDAFVRKTFDAFSADFDDVLTRLRYRAPQLVSEALGKALPKAGSPRSILDAGCGTGLCGPLLRPLAKTLVGVDLSSPMLSKARARRCYDDLVVAEITEYLKEHGEIWNGIASADVLVYFGDLREFLDAAAAALRPAGVLCFTTERAEAEEAPHGFRLNPTGRYSHTEEYLARALAEAGLTVRSFEEVRLRMEGGEPVRGTLALAVRE